jgi:hypothetical protein
MNHPCPICDNREADRQLIGPNTWIFSCPRCGRFAAASSNWEKVETPAHQVRLAGWIREQNATSPNPPFISQETSRRIARMPMPRLRERANRALAVIATKYPSLDQPTGFERLSEDLELQATTYSGNSRDAMVLTRILLEDGVFARP